MDGWITTDGRPHEAFMDYIHNKHKRAMKFKPGSIERERLMRDQRIAIANYEKREKIWKEKHK